MCSDLFNVLPQRIDDRPLFLRNPLHPDLTLLPAVKRYEPRESVVVGDEGRPKEHPLLPDRMYIPVVIAELLNYTVSLARGKKLMPRVILPGSYIEQRVPVFFSGQFFKTYGL